MPPLACYIPSYATQRYGSAEVVGPSHDDGHLEYEPVTCTHVRQLWHALDQLRLNGYLAECSLNKNDASITIRVNPAIDQHPKD